MNYFGEQRMRNWEASVEKKIYTWIPLALFSVTIISKLTSIEFDLIYVQVGLIIYGIVSLAIALIKKQYRGFGMNLFHTFIPILIIILALDSESLQNLMAINLLTLITSRFDSKEKSYPRYN